jgi:hypothetical protein
MINLHVMLAEAERALDRLLECVARNSGASSDSIIPRGLPRKRKRRWRAYCARVPPRRWIW